MNFYPDIEKEPLSVIKKFQEEKLIETLDYVNRLSPYYKNLFKKEKIDISKIKTLEDLRIIPLTKKEDLQINNKDFVCVDKSKIVDFITTSGTLNTPTTFALPTEIFQDLPTTKLFHLLVPEENPETFIN
jgi:phenylacetate-CoA ligase